MSAALSIRQSSRCKRRKKLMEEKRLRLSVLNTALISGCDQEGFQIRHVDETIGYGVFVTRDFENGDFLLEYMGELVSYKEGRKREHSYPADKGSFLFFFSYLDKRYCVDATEDPFDVCKGRIVNDEHITPNCQMKIVSFEDSPRLCLFAVRHIPTNTELRYDYGVPGLPWRKVQENKDTNGMAQVDENEDSNSVAHFDENKDSNVMVQVDENEDSNLMAHVDENEDFNVMAQVDENEDSNVMAQVDENEDSNVMAQFDENEDFSVMAQVDENKDSNVMAQVDENEDSNVMAHVDKNEDFNVMAEVDENEDSNVMAQVDENEDSNVMAQVDENEDSNAMAHIDENEDSNVMAQVDENEDSNVMAQVDENEDSNVMAQAGENEDSNLMSHVDKNEDSNVMAQVDENEDSNLMAQVDENEDSDAMSSDECEFSHGEMNDGDWHPESDDIYSSESEEDQFDVTHISETEDDFDPNIANRIPLQNCTNIVPEDDFYSHIASSTPLQNCTDTLSQANRSSAVPDQVHLHKTKMANGKKLLKQHACLYCSKMYPRISRHYQQVHSEELDVARVLSKPLKSQERKLLWMQLVNKGDFKHNFEVREKNMGVIIPKYRPRSGDEKLFIQYVPCEFCLAYFVSSDLWKHQKKCGIRKKEKKPKTGKPILNGKLLLPTIGQNKGFYENIFVKMRDDTIKTVLQKDPLIMVFADRLYEKNGHRVHHHQYIAQRVRELGRLIETSKLLNSDIDTLEKCLYPINWNKLIQTVKYVAGFDEETQKYQIPSLPLKLGHSLSKCAKLLKTQAIIDDDDELKKKASDFHQLYDSEWIERISSKAHKTLFDAKFNKPKYVPLAQDVTLLYKYLEQQIAIFKKERNYNNLAEALLAQLIMFNRKRVGEAQRLKVEDYKEGILEKEIPPDEEVMKCLSKFEIALCNTHKRVEIQGKKGSKVPVLFTEKMIANIHYLLKMRGQTGIDSCYLFVKPKCEHPIRGCDSLRKFANQCGARFPNLITSTALRKHLATMAQVLGLSEKSQDILAKFMGHDIRIHREFYRLPENTLEMAKVSKILHLINTGNISAYKDQDFDEISFDEADTIEDFSADWDKDEENLPVHNLDNNNDTIEDFSADWDKDEENLPVHNLDNNNGPEGALAGMKKKCEKRYVRRPWNLNEKAAIQRHMKKFLEQKTLPGKKECEEVRQKEEHLRRRSWKNIKDFVRNCNTKHVKGIRL